VLAALPGARKRELGRWLHWFGRGDMHKLAKEALVCLAESCMRDELAQVCVGGLVLPCTSMYCFVLH